jgi:hypothetical protein
MANVIPTQGKQVFSGRLIGSSPSQAEPKNIGFGQGDATAGTDVTAVTSDKALGAEIVANGAQTTRIAGTSSQVTTTNTNDTYHVTGTLTCNLGGGLAITEAGLFDTNAFPAQTTVATQGALSGTGTGTFTITSATGFPTASTDYQIQSEVLTGTLSGTTLTISARGANGSTAAAHAAGKIITVASATGTGAGGIMTAKGDFAVINLSQNDTLGLTAKVQFT